MIKVFSPHGWDFDCPVASPINLASDGLRGNDRREFIKRASGSENVFLPHLDQVKFAKDEQPVHMIAIGSQEFWGANRNGDGFSESTNKQAHDTFVKFAYYFRNHKNKKHEGHPHYGIVKLSAYNPTMRRIELLCGLFKTAEAAARHGGLVADKELEKLARGEDLPVSMAARVPHDICSACKNVARARYEYCKAASCWAGGCYDNLTKLIKTGKDVHHLYVDNPGACFFDISGVFRPADRTAYGGIADYLTKAAGDRGLFECCGIKAAEDLGVTAPVNVLAYGMTDVWNTDVHAQVKLAHGLDLLERQRLVGQLDNTRRAFDPEVQPPMPLEKLGLDTGTPASMVLALGALADNKILMPLRDFARMTKRADLAEPASRVLKGVYGRMLADDSLEHRVISNPYAPATKLASAAQRQEITKIAENFSIDASAIVTRATRSVLRQLPMPNSKSVFWNEKQAADSVPVEELARDYAVYKLAALHRIASFDDAFPLTCRIACCQNQTC